ncbi:stalk domain-containing protein [Cohnella silvisoli]|uniref:Copper amine oxidase n=1 Tax=Cohnella silvisoli TaxID=2873699 RepID=A0ABV1KZ10_9BACL|nr:copper amine oxidase [Cohnella silvisoli]MCD9024280.1 copper amine oxidase [Cohnella silvisoli]
MKVRKIILLTLIFTLICGSAVFADSITQKVRVLLNKKEVDAASVLVDNKPYISAKLVADKLQAILLWDESNKKVTIYKPNVHMLTKNKDNDIFGVVNKDKDQKVKFNVFTQIDTLKAEISAFKWTIVDPYQEETLIEARSSDDKDFPDSGKDNFWVNSKDISYTFDSAGSYLIRFWMKPVGESSYQVVSEKVITSK